MSVMLQSSFSLSNLSCNVDNGDGGNLVAGVHNCITCPILHEIVCIDLKCNGFELVLNEVELIHFVCAKCIRSI